MAKEIVFEIEDGGNVSIKMEGYTGKECDKAMKDVIHADFLKNGDIKETEDRRKVATKTKAKA